MNLREKILVILGIMFICAFLVIFVFSLTFYADSVSNQERQQDNYQSALVLIWNFLILITITLALFSIVVILLIDRLVLVRLTTLIDRVRDRSRLPEGQQMPPMPGNDEFAHLDTVIAESQHRILESEGRYRDLVEQVPDYIIVHRDKILRYVNPAAARIFGYNPAEIIGKPLDQFLAPQSIPDVISAIRLRQAGDPVKPYEIVILARDNSFRTVMVNGAIIQYEGKPATLNVLTDITEWKQTENALRIATKKLNMLNRAALNDLNNQLFTLQGYLELSCSLATDNKLKGYLLKQREVCSKLQNQVAFIRHFQDIWMQPPKWQNVNNVFLYAISHLDLSHFSRKVQLSTLEIYADPLLEKVLYAIAENSLVHGKTATEIRCYYTRTVDEVVIFFEDNGVGIPADKKEEIFRHHYLTGGFPLTLARDILSITDMAIVETGVSGQGARFEIHVKKGFFRFIA